MHFTVMVIRDDPELQMAPFQETNMGPIDARYMQKVDFTDEVRERYHARHRYWRLPDGSYVNFREAHERDGSGNLVPVSGASEGDMSADEARSCGIGFATMDDAADDCGASREGDRFFIEGNFNSQWDWYEIGGRWSSTLKLIPGRQGFTARPLEFDPRFAKVLGEPSPEIWEPKPGYCDQAQKRDIDWEYADGGSGGGLGDVASGEDLDERGLVVALGGGRRQNSRRQSSGGPPRSTRNQGDPGSPTGASA